LQQVEDVAALTRAEQIGSEANTVKLNGYRRQYGSRYRISGRFVRFE
jgi:hypothetical protein